MKTVRGPMPASLPASILSFMNNARSERGRPAARAHSGRAARSAILASIVALILQGCGAVKVEGAVETRMTAASNGYAYLIKVLAPAEPPPEGGYPAIYLLDAEHQFDETADILKKAGIPALLVGVAHVSRLDGGANPRFLDFTPTVDSVMCPDDPSGGAEAFLDFLEDELVPYVQSSFPVSTAAGDRCLMGHSLGGLLALYSAYTRPGLFGKCAASSSTVGWGGGDIFAFEEAAAARPEDFNQKIYACQGRYGDCIGAEIPIWEELMDRTRRDLPGIDLTADLFSGDYHSHSWRTSYAKALPALFGGGR